MARQTNVVGTRGYGHITRTKSPEAQFLHPSPTLPSPSPPSSDALPTFPLTYTTRFSRATPTAIAISVATDTTTARSPDWILSSIVRKQEKVPGRRKRGEMENSPDLRNTSTTANFILNLRDGRANELLNYSVALYEEGAST